MKMTRPRSLDLLPTRRRLKTPPAVALWRPDIVVATSITATPGRRPVVLGEPAARPEALHTQLGTARSLLATLAEARQLLENATVDGHDRAASTRERVSATIAAYRAEARLDDVLAGTWRQVSALMEERGLR